MRVLSGIKPTGRFHWGNYFGAIRQYIDLQVGNEAYYFIAEYHALTTVRDREQLRQHTLDAALDLLALGLDPAQASLFRQSDVPEVCELTWILTTITSMGLLERAHAYKDALAKGRAAEAGLFCYPVLMACDILAYDSEVVPVGEDQVQHLEITRDLATRFNHIFGETFVLPKAQVLDDSARVLGPDGEKMSKSYDNTIEVFLPEKKLRKKIMKTTTDSTPVEESKDPNSCNVFAMYKLFANEAEQNALAERYRAGGMGYGEAKQLLFEAARDHFAEANARREDFASRPDDVEDILRAGAKAAREKAAEVTERVRCAVGLRPVPANTPLG